MVLLAVRMGESNSNTISPSRAVLIYPLSFDNSGQRMSYPTWHSNQTNVDRTNEIIKTLISMVDSEYETVPIIAPLNE